MSHRVDDRATEAGPLPPAIVAVLPRLRALRGVPPAAIRATRLAGWSNAAWRLETPHGTFALRLPGPRATNAIDRADEVHATALAAELGVGLKPLQHDVGDGLLLTPWVETREGASRPGPGRVGELLARLHRSGAAFRWRFEGEAVAERQVENLPTDDPAWPLVRSKAARAVALLRELEASRGSLAPCHNDPSPANLVDDGRRLLLIDWEYAGQNDPFWDLAAYAEEAALDEAGRRELLAGWGDDGAEASARLDLQRAACRWIAGLWFLAQAARRGDAILRAEALRRLEPW